MRILKRLKKALLTACLGVAVATTWFGATPARAFVEEVPLQVQGYVEPTEQGLNHVHFLYGTGTSAMLMSDIDSFRIPELPPESPLSDEVPAGVPTTFDEVVLVDPGHDEFYWMVVGAYGPDNGGAYDPGINGVCVSLYFDSSGWDDFFLTPEYDVFAYLVAEDAGALEDWLALEWMYGPGWPSYPMTDITDPLTDMAALFSFTEATFNGEAVLGPLTEPIPEPSAVWLVGAGLGALALRRRK